MWKKIDSYHLRNNDWTIAKYGKDDVKYALWHGAINKGWFSTADEAKAKYDELSEAESK